MTKRYRNGARDRALADKRARQINQLAGLAKEICKEYETKLGFLRGPWRDKQLVQARKDFIQRAFLLLGKRKIKMIAWYLGRDTSTIWYHCKRLHLKAYEVSTIKS